MFAKLNVLQRNIVKCNRRIVSNFFIFFLITSRAGFLLSELKLIFHLYMVAHMVQNSSFYIQRKFYNVQRKTFIFRENFILFREKFSTSEKSLLHSEKHFHIQRTFLYSKKFSIFRENVYLKKFFTFREGFYI